MARITYNGKTLQFDGKSLNILPSIDITGIKYGRLYNHYVTSDSITHSGLISGFTLPTYQNFYDDLAVYIRNTHSIPFDEEAIALKSTRTQPTLHPRWNTGNIATDEFNFSSLPGGQRLPDGTFEKVGELGNWWNQERASSTAWYTQLAYDTSYPMGAYEDKKYGFSIRLIKPYTGGAISDGTIFEQVTDYDNNIYNVVKIGSYAWTVENLKTTHFVDGTEIPNVSGDTAWGELTTGAYCNYDNYIE